MRNVTIFLISLMLIVKVNAQKEPSLGDLGVAAIGLVVSDIEKSEKFYTKIIGMVPAGQFELSEEWSNDAGMSNGEPFAVKMFKMVNEPSSSILKLAYFERTERRPQLSGISDHSGVNYLTLHYNDLTDVLKRVKDAGIPIVGKVERNYKLVIIRDPDGVYVELVQLPKE